MDWETISKVIGVVGLPGALALAILFAGMKRWWVWGRELENEQKENQRLRDEMATMRERHRQELDRLREMHRVELGGWQQMAIQNNVIAMRAATNVDRAADIAEKAVDKVAPTSQQTPP